MKIEEFLSPSAAIVDLNAPSKSRLLQELADRAADTLGLDGNRVGQELLKREDLGSTGVGAGVAIPHARLGELEKPFGMIARLKRAIDFDAIDGAPVDLIFLLLLPLASQGDLNPLAAAARALRDPEKLSALRRASDGANLYRAITQ